MIFTWTMRCWSSAGVVSYSRKKGLSFLETGKRRDRIKPYLGVKLAISSSL